ncbi:hypothetical protein RFI_28541 [Reticulomyxa filosa]|uniref:Uncharacterized protein n=1 Tax=Reticulomyxa filosa TaxID=46433 RepID=X6M5E9_RETFI|nr:hypothetical protein RFI_28541 [Reticulomyxa filosa]|eukprot:ETO08846.1 hypothetical protein RFI_28541 [Reticulomyxa filosa]
MFCSFYRSLHKTNVKYKLKPEDDVVPTLLCFNLDIFEQEVAAARKVTELIIIGGDWNAHHPAWLDENIDNIGENVLYFIVQNGLQILNSSPFNHTFEKNNGKSSIDISLCSHSILNLCSNWRTDNDELDLDSDHLPITFSIRADWSSSTIKKQKIETWNLRNNNWELFRQILKYNLEKWYESLTPYLPNNPEFLDAAVESWTECVVDAGKRSIGMKTIWKGNKPWWSDSLHRKRKQVHRLKREFRRCRTPYFYNKYKEAAAELKRKLRCEKQEYLVRSIQSLQEGNSRQLFSQFRSMNSNKIGVIPALFCPTTNYAAKTDNEKAELLISWFAQPPQPPNFSDDTKEHYQSVEDEIVSAVEMKRESEINNCDEFLEPHQETITEVEIIEALRHISAYKAQGPDSIHNQMLKNGGQSMIDSMSLLFDWSFKIGYVPKLWKRANIIPIPKPDRDHSMCKNYRPIALLSSVGKLLERIITMRLMWYLNENQLLHQCQAGFQSWHNTSELLLRITESIHASFDNNSVTYATFLDISSAYDSVWRDGLRYKMRREFGLNGRMYWWLDSFLKDRVGQVVLNGVSSNEKKFDTGVPQGSALSPLLFLLYINDITQTVQDPIQCGMFADDVALWTSIYTSDQQEMQRQLNLLQQSLNNVSLWASRWKMLLAPDKTQSITFRMKNKAKYPKMQLTLNNIPIQDTEQVKYLGLIMDSNLTYQRHINYVYGKTAKKLGYLTFLCSYKGIRPSLSVYNLLYKAIIRPSLEYACAFWNGAAQSHKCRLERIQRLAMCRILGVMNSTAYDTVNMITQLPPLELRRQQEEVKLYHKCIRWSTKFPNHNLTLGFLLWKRNHDIQPGEKFCWLGKLSTLSRAYIHAKEVGVPKVEPDQHSFHNRPPMHVEKIPHPKNSPFEEWMEPTPGQILESFDDNTVVIFADGSTKPEPGIGGAGLGIQDQSLPNWLELEFPIKGITTAIGSEIEAVRQGLEYITNNYKDTGKRLVILSDCKFAVNTILNKFNSESYNFPVSECQQIMKNLGSSNVPEIYWIKGHSGIPGNERADAVAKRARFKAELNQPDLFRRPDRTAPFLNFHDLNPSFTAEWNRHWTNEGNEMKPHKHAKRFLRNLIESQSFEKIVLHNLDVHERRFVCRIITGKVGLNAFLFKIKRSHTPYCKWCEGEEETVEHFLMKCPHYEEIRDAWRVAVKTLLPLLLFTTSNLRSLVVGDKTWEPAVRIKIVKQLAKFVLATERKI